MTDLLDHSSAALSFISCEDRVQWGRITPMEDFLSRAPRARMRTGTVGDLAANTPLDEYQTKISAKHEAQQQLKSQIATRIRELQLEAFADSAPYSDCSLTDLHKFFDSLSFTKGPAIFLLDNGNLRALWKNNKKEQVGLQFLGGGVIQFVFFIERQVPPMMSRVAGTDTHTGIRQRLADFERLIG
jgi:hypothetical protein